MRSVCSSYFSPFFMCGWIWIKSVHVVCLRQDLLLVCVFSHSSRIRSSEHEPLSNSFCRERAGTMEGGQFASRTLATTVKENGESRPPPPACGHLSYQPFVSLQRLKALGQFPMA